MIKSIVLGTDAKTTYKLDLFSFASCWLLLLLLLFVFFVFFVVVVFLFCFYMQNKKKIG